ncbi:toprim domain-containing protein [Taibaiella koreensis]|uniref:toprim domain-containing protein n=1 Tax=Taibaiella koreensis TaxID=1268548 RepID=UPI000E59B1CB|nr:toprim domain-containing protein [Taibaiella koreensis]
MNIEQANQIPIHRIVEYIGGTYSRKGRNGELWYFSPFRPEERTASFKVDERKNRWHDFGHVSASGVSGGDVIALWCEYYNLNRKVDAKEVLQALKGFSNVPDLPAMRKEKKQQFRQQVDDATQIEEPRFKIIKLHQKIFFPALLEELSRRHITPAIANLYLKQVFLSDVENPDRKLNGFAFANYKGGYEISIPNLSTGKSFKTSTRPKTYTLIEGQDNGRAAIFEGFWDFLSDLEMQKITVPKCDTYILNSVSFWHEVAEEITKKESAVSSVLLYMDNDKAGDMATNNFAFEFAKHDILVGCKRHSYSGFKDLNEKLINKRT